MRLISESGPPRRSGAVAAVIVAAMLAIAFGWPSRHGEFQSGDDHGLVLEHALVNHPSWGHAWTLLTMIHGDLYQPLPMLSFQANYRFFAADPTGYHLTNIGLHALNTMLVVLLALRLSGCARVSALTGAMFACHPLAAEPVAWISGRMILLATFFSLVTLNVFAYRRADAGPRFGVTACLAWAGALLSKVLPTVPIACAWCDAFVHPRTDGPAGRSRRWWLTLAVLLGMTAGMTALAVRTTKDTKVIDIINAELRTPAPVRMLLAARYYLENYVWPVRLSAWSPPPFEAGYFSRPVGVALLECAALGAVVLAAWRWCRTALLGLGMFLILLAPFIAAVKARNFLTADRYMYLPMAGLHLALAAAVIAALDALRRRYSAATAGPLVAAPCVVVLALWMRVGWAQAAVWHDTVAQGLHAMAINPHDVRVRVELARAYVFKEDAVGALAAIADARQRWPDDPALAGVAGEAYRLLERWEDAERELRYASEQMPDAHRSHYYLGLTLEKLGRAQEARALWARILADRDNFIPAQTAMARSLRDEGRLDEALTYYDQAIRNNPYHRAALFEAAEVLTRRGRYAEAAGRLRELLAFDADDEAAKLNLAVCLARMGRADEALAIYDALLSGDLSLNLVRLNRAALLEVTGRLTEAEADYRAVFEADPSNRAAAVGLHTVLQAQERYGEIGALWERHVAAGGSAADAAAWRDWARLLAGETPPPSAVPTDGDAGTYFQAFAPVWGGAAPGAHSALRELSPPQSEAQRDELRAVTVALAGLGRQRPADPAVLYATVVALWLQGDTALAARFAAQLDAAATNPEWRELSDEMRTRLSRAAAPRE